MYKGKKVSVVVPAYNEELLIDKTLDSMPGYIDHIIVVDDCSKDSTSDRARKRQKALGARLIVIRHEINRGVGAAIVTGYKRSLELGCDISAVMAGDAQMDPAHLPDLLDPIVDGSADYTKGNRLDSKHIDKMPKVRRRGNAILSVLTKVSSGYWDIIDPQNGYTAISRRALEGMDLDRVYPRYGYCNDILVRLNINNMRVMDVVMPPVYGTEKSKIKIKTYTPHMMRLLTGLFFHRLAKKYGGVRFHPLLLFFMVGLIMLPVGVGMGAYLLGNRILNGSAGSAGTQMLASIFIIVGLQFILFAMLFDVLNTRMCASTGQTNGGGDLKMGVGAIASRMRAQYWGRRMHPIALFYIAGFAMLAFGAVMSAAILYLRIMDGRTASVGTEMLAMLSLMIGIQSVLFSMVFEVMLARTYKV